MAQWGSGANPYRFASDWGYRDDGDAGLLHVGARYHDSQGGRFISQDPVLSEHPYLYGEYEALYGAQGRALSRLKHMARTKPRPPEGSTAGAGWLRL